MKRSVTIANNRSFSNNGLLAKNRNLRSKTLSTLTKNMYDDTNKPKQSNNSNYNPDVSNI